MPTIHQLHEDKKNRIIQAAVKAYALYGIDLATTRQIAEIAGIGKSTIYEYFKNKIDLLDAAIEYLTTRTSEGHKQIHEIAKTDPLKALTSTIDHAINIALQEPSTLLLISQYTLGILLKTDRFETAKAEYQKKMSPLMQDLTNEFRFIITYGIELKVFRPSECFSIEGLVYTITALIREIQAQAFLKEQADLLLICKKIKETIYNLLGLEIELIREENDHVF